jgi:hypothetical protein
MDRNHTVPVRIVIQAPSEEEGPLKFSVARKANRCAKSAKPIHLRPWHQIRVAQSLNLPTRSHQSQTGGTKGCQPLAGEGGQRSRSRSLIFPKKNPTCCPTPNGVPSGHQGKRVQEWLRSMSCLSRYVMTCLLCRGICLPDGRTIPAAFSDLEFITPRVAWGDTQR